MNEFRKVKNFSGFDAYKIYHAMNLHFSSNSYDAIKYKYKSNINMSSYEKRRDKIYFEKIAKKLKNKNNVVVFSLAHILYNTDNVWIGDAINDIEPINKYKKYYQSFSYRFNEDMSYLIETYPNFKFTDIIKTRYNTNCKHEIKYPILIKEYLDGNIDILTCLAIEKLTKFTTQKQNIEDNLLWPLIKLKINKGSYFIDDKFDQIIAKIILEKYKREK